MGRIPHGNRPLHTHGRVVLFSKSRVVAALSAASAALVTTSLFQPPAALAVTNGPVEVTRPGSYSAVPRFLDYGYDIKQEFKRDLSTGRADVLFNEMRFTTLRIPIMAAQAHPLQGVENIDDSDYAQVIQSVRNAKAVAPNTKVFASLILVPGSTTSEFPGWTKSAGSVQWDKYAQLIVDYLKYFRNKGIDIDVLGPDNERKYNDGEIGAVKYAQIVRRVRYLAPDTVQMPKFIAPENFYPDTPFLDSITANGDWGTVDIAGTHYYNEHRTEQKPQLNSFSAAVKDGVPKWDTEFHWNDIESVNQYVDSRNSILAAFDNFDRDFTGLTWWSFNPFCDRVACESTEKARMQTTLVESTVGAYMIASPDDQDGANSDFGTFVSRAFVQPTSTGRDVIVWIVNDKGVSYSDKQIKINGYQIPVTSQPTFKQWSGGTINYRSGPATVDATLNSVRVDLPAQSITMVRIPNAG